VSVRCVKESVSVTRLPALNNNHQHGGQGSHHPNQEVHDQQASLQEAICEFRFFTFSIFHKP
jgi:hypothetical protein